MMGLDISLEVILFFALGLALLYLLSWFLIAPFKLILKLLANGILGGIALYLINLVGGVFNVTIAINPWTALTVGFLGLPGVVLLYILKLAL